MNAKKAKIPPARKADLDPYLRNLLKGIADGKTVLRFQKNGPIFAQGDKADAIYFIQAGKVKITVVSSAGKEAVLAVLGPRGFLGEGCLVGQGGSDRHRDGNSDDDALPHRAKSNASGASRSARSLGEIHRILVISEHRFGRGSLRSALQPQRKTAGARAA